MNQTLGKRLKATVLAALCHFPIVAIGQSCDGRGTTTTLKHADGSFTRVETDRACNTNVENANPVQQGPLVWRGVGNYRDRNHSEIVKERSGRGTVNGVSVIGS